MADTEQASSKLASAPKSTKTEAPASSAQQKGTKASQKTHSSKLEDQAASAALYVTKDKRKSGSGETWLDSNNKLSSAGAAASLKYATAKDLPSYPSSGLPPNASAAGAAATLGWANQKPFEHWKPDPSSAASTAAMLAKDYKMDPLWQPQQSSNGAKAALLAHRDSAKVEIWKPEPSAWSNSAAILAVQAQKKGTPSPQVVKQSTGPQGSLLAATGAMAGSRRRAESTPVVAADTYPDQSNAVANALSAATVAHKPSASARFSPTGTSTAVTNLSREMYTSNPPVAQEVEERQRAGALRASAVAMAQKMYTIQQKQIDAAAQDHSGLGIQAAASAHRRESVSTPSEEASPMRFSNLHEAAQKLAQQRLSKLHDEHIQAREYREYYGDSKPKPAMSKRLSLAMPATRGRTRNRASSEGAGDEDAEQSQKIRAQMSLFSSNLSKVTSKKRQEDREALIAIAQRNVAKSLHGMDEKVFEETGKVNPGLMNEWEMKAQAAAQAKSDTRMQNHGKINIGGGKFVSQSAVDLVAAKNVQPALDDINEKTEAEHARQTEVKADQEANKRTEESKKQREKEEKEVQKKLKQQDKEEAKAAKEEEKRLAKEEKRKSKDARKSFIAPKTETEEPVIATAAATEPTTTASGEESHATRLALDTEQAQPSAVVPQEGNASAKSSPTATSPKAGGRVKSWFKSTFASVPHSRSMSKSQKSEPGAFIGGAALTGGASANNSQHSIPREEEPHAVSKPGAGATAVGGIFSREDGADRTGRSEERADSVSSASMTGGREEFEEARDDFDEGLAPPPHVVEDRTGASSPIRETKFREEIS